MGSQKKIIKNIKTESTFDILYKSFDDISNNDDILYKSFNNISESDDIVSNHNNIKSKYDTIIFHYNFNNEKIKYKTKIKTGDSITLKKYINEIYNKDL
jgi:hypothetical protein